VTVVSYAVDGEPRGVTVNSFTSVSLDPPLLLVSLARSSRACGVLADVPFAVNVLRADQVDVALHFAGRPRPGTRVRWQYGEGVPELDRAVAVFRCRPWRAYDGGDHVLHLGEVVDAEHRPGEPLLFTGGLFAMTGLPLVDGSHAVGPGDSAAKPWLLHARRLHDGIAC
jgi:flavin reductase (DIM6/NTAB) family NADH-FMN oxidoreductase RutF